MELKQGFFGNNDDIEKQLQFSNKQDNNKNNKYAIQNDEDDDVNGDGDEEDDNGGDDDDREGGYGYGLGENKYFTGERDEVLL